VELTGCELQEALSRSGVKRGDLVGLAVAPGVGIGMALANGQSLTLRDARAVGQVDEALRPRWAVWSNEAAAALVRAGVRVATCWDLAAVHRLLFGGWRADPARVWAAAQDLALDGAPSDRPPDLFSHARLDDGDREEPLQPDGYLRPEWAGGGWSDSPERTGRWASLALVVAVSQQAMLDEMEDRPRSPATARSESTAELLCAELSHDGLPLHRGVAERILGDLIGPRPSSAAEAASLRSHRDAEVLAQLPAGIQVDLRSPGQVKALLGRLGLDLPDTRAWRLRAMQDAHPVVAPLLKWRKAERVASTYGYGWLDEHLGPDGRLRGNWTGCDGAAGRMTASAGLHNMPADFRPAVLAEAGHVFVRADLGQIEPRVLAAVSGDVALAKASIADDMYAPVAEELKVDRATAKVAVLGAMYGQTTGYGADALRGLQATYPVAMAYLEAADRAGRAGQDLRTYGGRRISMGSLGAPTATAAESVARAGARGRYGRNAMVQGAAAELFKMWAVTVRARAVRYDARIVLCLHDELLLQVPATQGEEVAALIHQCLDEAADRWAPRRSVRYVADVGVITRWSDAKG
jgi:DNA polymerase I